MAPAVKSLLYQEKEKETPSLSGWFICVLLVRPSGGKGSEGTMVVRVCDDKICGGTESAGGDSRGSKHMQSHRYKHISNDRITIRGAYINIYTETLQHDRATSNSLRRDCVDI